jgi:hypothetical protein
MALASTPLMPLRAAGRGVRLTGVRVRVRAAADRYNKHAGGWTFSMVRDLSPARNAVVVSDGSDRTAGGIIMGLKNTVRVVTRAGDGTLRIRDYPTTEPLLEMHSQIGIDDCSTDLGLRGLPVFKGLIGPMPEGKNVIRYESPDVFETLTKEWSSAKNPRRRRRMQPPQGIGEPLLAAELAQS